MKSEWRQRIADRGPQRDLFHVHGGLGQVNLDVVCGPDRAPFGDDGAAHKIRRGPDVFVAFQGELERHWRLLAVEIDTLLGRYRVDASGAQIGMQPVVVQILHGHAQPVWPLGAEEPKPFVAWSERKIIQ